MLESEDKQIRTRKCLVIEGTWIFCVGIIKMSAFMVVHKDLGTFRDFVMIK